jgi:hypothetical protein
MRSNSFGATDDFGSTDKGASPTIPEKRSDSPVKTADDRRDELKTQEVLSQNVQMRHKPTGEVTTYHRDALKNEKLYVPALRDEFPRDQFEEFKERST